ncbi:hypothetical protein Thiowin_04287 [Thiorhodovibrio winogradskyi]|uniref:DUF4214 domain-containing protein n=1 Tax=Thiorhodovibrio winogradskyi TaxID=77007 RepID=A0ABZ0SHY6_9GAMM|nr:DUF4214 domain-containing protein [Thiorhodovibrio winogradskyi]
MVGTYQVAVVENAIDSVTAGEARIDFGGSVGDRCGNDRVADDDFVGGSDVDKYVAKPGVLNNIQDAGNSPWGLCHEIVGALIEVPVDLIVDNRHLAVPERTLATKVLIVDWEDSANRIEIFSTTNGRQDFEDYRDCILPLPEALGQIRSETSFVNPDFPDTMMGQAYSSSAHYEFNTGVQITRAEAINVALLYGAALGREPDVSGLNFWIDQRVAGMSLETIAGAFLESVEFTTNYGDDDLMSTHWFITVMYQNVLGRLPDEGGFVFWEAEMTQGRLDREDVLMFFADSAENRANATYIDLMFPVEDNLFTLI